MKVRKEARCVAMGGLQRPRGRLGLQLRYVLEGGQYKYQEGRCKLWLTKAESAPMPPANVKAVPILKILMARADVVDIVDVVAREGC